jgi:phosphate starvation-inducible protein PhoH
VVAETYDEVVFTDPSESFYNQLLRISVIPKVESSQQEHLQKVFNDNDDFLALLEAQKLLQDEISKAKERFRVVSEELQAADQELATSQSQQQHQQQQHQHHHQQQQQQQQQREAAAKKAKASAPRKPKPPSTQPTKKAKIS